MSIPALAERKAEAIPADAEPGVVDEGEAEVSETIAVVAALPCGSGTTRTSAKEVFVFVSGAEPELAEGGGGNG